MENQNVEQAKDDLAYIRKALETFQRKNQTKLQIKGGVAIHCFLTSIVLLLIGIELVTNNQITNYLSVIRYDQELKIFTIAYISTLTALILGLAYLYLTKLAKSNSQPVSEFFAKNFSYLSNISLASDLAVKLVLLSVLILIDKSNWIIPALFLFLGDFLVQGKVFNFSIKSGFGLAVICFVMSGLSLAIELNSLLLPFCAFALLSGISAWNLHRSRGDKA